VSQSKVPLRIAIVAAEPSGDLLAAGLMAAVRERLPDVVFEGVAGPRMQREGIDSWAPMDSLSVMGLFEVLRHLPRLLRLRSGLLARWRETPPALFIGVDAPDFNLTLEERLRAQGIPTVHYVSPTVWAWRTGRVRKLRRAVDRLLVIFPFEKPFLADYGIAADYVGHRLANAYPLAPDCLGARADLGLDATAPTLAVLPGSRGSEVSRLSLPFLETALRLREHIPALQIVVPLANTRTRGLFEAVRSRCCPALPVRVVVDATRQALAAADAALVASGTATFECLLSKRPMVVGYKANPATYRLIRMLRLVRVKHVAMANLLSGEPLAPELIQAACTPARLLPPLQRYFDDAALRARIAARYAEVHTELCMDSDHVAAQAVVDLLQERGLG
jgi:lipid-A-disaccharide synthase